MKWFTEIIPFFSPYPLWVKLLVSAWFMLTAACIAALIIANPRNSASATSKQPRDSNNPAQAGAAWLKINNVEIFDPRWKHAGVRVTAEINGNAFVYPNIGGAEWVVAGPDMSRGLFKIPASEVFQVTFSMEAKRQGVSEIGQFVSQRTVIIRKAQLPASETYAVHKLGEEKMRSAGIGAEISFAISGQPD